MAALQLPVHKKKVEGERMHSEMEVVYNRRVDEKFATSQVILASGFFIDAVLTTYLVKSLHVGSSGLNPCHTLKRYVLQHQFNEWTDSFCRRVTYECIVDIMI